jgi:hypothetical protein
MSETKPKRTRKPRAKSKGLGDSIEKVTKATGIDKLVKFIAGEDCGCDERKEKLNKMFPYFKPLCLLEYEYNELTEFFNGRTSQIKPSQQKKLLSIYNRVLNQKQEPTTCSDCWRDIINKLRKVYDEY